jgi:ketosteroid isomerase-like protein
MGVSHKSVAAGAALLLIGSLAPTLTAPPQRDAERGVRRALIRLNSLLAERDPAIAAEFLDSPETLLVGSAAAESARGRDEVLRHFEQIFARPEMLAFAWRRVEVSVRGSVAWLYAEGELVRRKDETETREPYRLSGVLEQHGGRWLWRLFHGSQPAS